MDALGIILCLVNIGNTNSLACHPAATSHRQLNAQDLIAAQVPKDLVPISLGTQHVSDIIANI
ncbi:MAG: PLP-dependent transferase [Oceanospirillaceae bacterium]